MNERKGATFTVLWPIVIVMTLLAPSLLAQGDALRGTWSLETGRALRELHTSLFRRSR